MTQKSNPTKEILKIFRKNSEDFKIMWKNSSEDRERTQKAEIT